MKRWLRYLWENENGFFGIGQGPSGTEKTQYGETANLANFATSEGEKDIITSDAFWAAIMSGDPAQMSKVLGPVFSRINASTQQAKLTAGTFGNRGGGTNAAMQNLDTNARTSVDQTIAELTGKAASTLGSTGGNLLNTGLTGHEAAFGQAKTIHDQNAAKWNDIFKSIADTAGAVAGGFGGGVGGAAFSGFSNAGQISDVYGGPSSVATQPIDTSGWDQQI